MNSYESAPKGYSLPCRDIEEIKMMNLTGRHTAGSTKRRPKLMRNHKVVQKLFYIHDKDIMQEFTFSKPKRALPNYLPDTQEDQFLYFINKMTNYYRQTFAKYGLNRPKPLVEVS